jgi:hypothetical protein
VSHENVKAFAGTDVPHPQGGVTGTRHDPENKSDRLNYMKCLFLKYFFAGHFATFIFGFFR